MRIGFYTNYTPEIAEFAQRVGFRSLELSAWPHSSLNPEKVEKSAVAALQKDLAARDIEVEPLDGGDAARKELLDRCQGQECHRWSPTS